MESLTSRIKSKIRKKMSVSLFADDIGIRQATLYDFLNEKIEVKLPTLIKIIEPLGMGIVEKMPDNFMPIDTVYLDGKTFKKGNKYKRKEIVLCFGNPDTSYQGMLLKGKDDLFTLKMF